MVPGEEAGQIPTQLAGGRYQLGDVLGTGACATVYAATDTLLGVERAVKVIGTGSSARHGELAVRLVTEARAMARLSHPNILRVYDVGVDGELRYVVMDLARGGSLGRVVEVQGALSPDLALRYCLQVLSALAAAHADGVVHRDVKPANILLSERHAALLADFGIAMLAGDEARSTRTNVGMGSFAYMAPEQRVNARHVGPTADLYGVACTLYYLLTGASPIDLFAVADRHSERWQGLPPELVGILQRALRYDPEERFGDARAMAAALKVALEGARTEPLVVHDPLDPHNFPEPSARFSTDDHRVILPRREGLPGPPAADFEASLSFLEAPEPVAYPTLVAQPGAIGDTAALPPPEPIVAEEAPGREGRLAGVLAAALVVVGVGAAAASLWRAGSEEELRPEREEVAVAVEEEPVREEPAEEPTEEEPVEQEPLEEAPVEEVVPVERVPPRAEEPVAPAAEDTPVAVPPVEESPVEASEPPLGRWRSSFDGAPARLVLRGSREELVGTYTLDDGAGAITDVTGRYDPGTRTLLLEETGAEAGFAPGRYELKLGDDGRLEGRFANGLGVATVTAWREG